MSVQVNVYFKVAVFLLLDDSLLCLVDSWLLMRRGIQVKPIQIVVVCIKSVVSSRDTIRIEKRYDLKLELF